MSLSRRGFLFATAAAVALFRTRRGAASIARGVELSELCQKSERAVVARAVDVESRWENVGGRRRIVTYSRLVVDETLGGPADTELFVRTLGGQVGDVGQIVHGEALLLVGEPAVVFLAPTPDGVLHVTAMAQGHYPIRNDADGTKRLQRSPRAPEIVKGGRSAAEALVGQRLSDGLALTRKAWTDAH